MQAFTNTPTILTTIKGTNLNKGKARTWIELPESKLIEYGFTKGSRYNLEFLSDGILITSNPTGDRKVSGKLKKSGTYCIWDICYPLDKRLSMFSGSERLTVWISNNQIMVTI